MAAVQMPDGQVVDLPDNPSPEVKAAVQAKVELGQLQGVYNTKLAQAQEAFRAANKGAEPPSYLSFPGKEELDTAINQRKDKLAWARAQQGGAWEKAKYYAKFGAGKLVEGAASLPVFLADLAAVDPVTGESNITFGLSKKLANSVQSPQTPGQEHAASVLQGVSGALASPAGVAAPVRSAIVGASAGEGSEIAAKLLGADKWYSRPIGALLGGGLAGFGSAAKTTREDLVKQATRGVTEQELRNAQQAMQESLPVSGQVGINVAQAMGRDSPLDSMVRNLANSRYGTATQRQLDAQPSAVQRAVELELGGMPGKVIDPHIAANNMQDTATGVLQGMKAERTRLWDSTYQKGLAVLRDAKQKAADISAENAGAYQQALETAQQKLAGLRQALADSQGQDAAAVAAANKKLLDAQEAIKNLEGFPLPRGSSSGNTGRFFDEAKRGESIINSTIQKEVTLDNLKKNLPEAVQPGESLTTSQLRRQVADSEREVAAAGSAAKSASNLAAGAQTALENVGNVPAQAVQREVARLKALANGELKNTPKGQALSDIADSLLDSSGAPITSGANLREVLTANADKYTLKGINLNTSGVGAGALKYIQSQLATTRQNLGENFAPMRDANTAARVFSENVYDPAKRSVIGRVAGVGGDAQKEAAISRAFGVFEKGTMPKSKTSDILTLEKAMRGQPDGPAIFQDTFKTWVQGKLSKALQDGATNRVPDSLPKAMVKVFGDPSKDTAASKGFQDSLVAIARSQGLPDNSLINGWKQVQNFASAAAVRPGTVGDASRQLERVAAGAGQEILRTNEASVLFGVRNWLRDLRAGDAYAFIDKLVTTPEGIDTLVKLSKQPVMSKAAANTLATFQATLAAKPREEAIPVEEQSPRINQK